MHSTTDQPVEEQFRNSLCRDIGHDWKTTTAPNYRTCTRTKCKAAQRLNHGRWVDIPSHATATSPIVLISKQQALPAQPLSIWADGDLSQQGA